MRESSQPAVVVIHKAPAPVIADPEMMAEAKAAAGQAHRVGWLPILVLAIAVIALVAYLLFR
jgi:hypothetical protein